LCRSLYKSEICVRTMGRSLKMLQFANFKFIHFTATLTLAGGCEDPAAPGQGLEERPTSQDIPLLDPDVSSLYSQHHSHCFSRTFFFFHVYFYLLVKIFIVRCIL
jgi:hypothetical protein